MVRGQQHHIERMGHELPGWGRRTARRELLCPVGRVRGNLARAPASHYCGLAMRWIILAIALLLDPAAVFPLRVGAARVGWLALRETGILHRKD